MGRKLLDHSAHYTISSYLVRQSEAVIMPTLEKGQIFERYRIIQWLGSGVSGESYEAEDTMLLRKVTLKLVYPTATLPDAARRQFFREMQGISILSHPYLAPVLDYGEFDGKLYVARRYISNGSLLGNNGRLWFRAPLDVFDAIQYGHQLAQALQHVHNRGYLHGALTFTNILVLRGPNLENESDYAPFLLADVGLTNFVRRFGEQDSISLPLPITAAPEQLYKRVIPASDQFALAVVLYFWLGGLPPYIGSPEEIEQLKLTETITPLSSFNPSITVEQDGVILRALSLSPEDRYHSVLAFTNALLATLPPKTQPVSETEPTNQTAETIQVASEPTPQSLAESTPEPLSQTVSETKILQQEPAFVTQPELEGSELPPEPESDVQSATDHIPQPVLNVPQPSPELSELETSHQAELLPIAQLTDTQEYLSEKQDKFAAVIAHLIIISPYAEEPYTVELQDDETTIGRAGSSDIFLDRDDLTSRHHALLRRENNGYVLYDRRSANGVQVNGQQLQGDSGSELIDGDHISIGNYELIFRLGMPEVTDQEDRRLATQKFTTKWGA
jgi:serine/threonine protein kinase